MDELPSGGLGAVASLEPGEGLLHGLQRVGHDLAQPRLDLLDRDARLQALRERFLRACSTHAPSGIPASLAAAVTASRVGSSMPLIAQLLATPSLSARCRSCTAG